MNKIRIAGAAAGVVLVSGVVLQVSSAAFTGETTNADNAWDAGHVTLTGGDAVSAMYNTATETNIVPGYSQTRCIEVTYDGSVTPSKAIELYASTTSTADPLDGVGDDAGDGLADDLKVSVRIGNANTTCAFFSTATSTEIRSAVALDTFATSAAPLSTTWRPDPDGALNLGLGTDLTRAFQFTVTLPNDATTDNDAQGDEATADFTWRSTS